MVNLLNIFNSCIANHSPLTCSLLFLQYWEYLLDTLLAESILKLMIWQEISAAEAFLCRSRMPAWSSSREHVSRSFVMLNQKFIKEQMKLTAIVLTCLIKYCVTPQIMRLC